MTADTGRMPGTSLPVRASPLSRICGLGSVYAKTLRDSRLAVIIVAGLIGIMLISSGVTFAEAYATEQSRIELKLLIQSLPPAMAGVYGNPFPVAIETLGGSIGWKTASTLGLITALWSILALSGTLAGEARRGSLEFIATTPVGKRRIAIEKLAAHLTGMAVVLVVTALSAYIAGQFGTLPGDEISVENALGYATWIGVIALASGGIAFVCAPLVGRGPAAAIAGAVMLVGYFANGYQTAVPAFAPLANVTWFGWAAHHQPLGGQSDWPSLIPGAVVAAGLLIAGVESFARRDIGSTNRIPWPSMPASALGLAGPVSRSFGERLPLALSWGIGVGIMGFIFGAAALSFSDALDQLSPDTLAIFRAIFPDIDIHEGAGAFLQLAFVTFGFVLAGFAAATLVNGWASDETDGRLEMLLSAPMSRARWTIMGGVGLYVAIAVFTGLLMLGIGIGSMIAGGDVLTPITGAFVVGLYALALAGIGLALGGLFGTSFAGEAVALIVILTFLADFLVPALDLPDVIRELAITAHLGQPMVGIFDWPGMIACVAIAIGGLGLAAWGMRRRDVAR